jgi:cellulose synthase/poly-beta-1,6-N-acetylglucosamine synthase-like glycosyltransferase
VHAVPLVDFSDAENVGGRHSVIYFSAERRSLIIVPAARVVVLVPAHDEEETLVESLMSVDVQSYSPVRKIVMADNCTDRTEWVARSHRGWNVWCSEGNRHRKAGALNQAWERLAPSLAPEDYLLVMDADTRLDRNFIVNSLLQAQRRSELGGICASFYGKDGGGVLGFFQRLEFARFARSLARKGGQTFVLSGTATLFPAHVLRRLGEERGYLYDTTALIEDYEISLALRHRGYRIYAPRDCRVYTDVMSSLTALWRQRIRWQRGTLHELRRYGWTRYTLPDIGRQFLLVGATLARLTLFTMIVLSFIVLGGLDVKWGWMACSGVIAVERALTVRTLGWKYSLVASTIFLEEIYGALREAWFVRSAWLAFFGDSAEWQWHKT